MPAVVPSAAIRKKTKRSAWDYKGRFEDLEENFIATREQNAVLMEKFEQYNERINALEATNSILHKDNEVKSVEAVSQINDLQAKLK